LECQLGAGETANDQPAGYEAGQPQDGRVPTLRGGPEAGFPTSDSEVETEGHPVSSSRPVSFIPLAREHVVQLVQGRRLRVGDQYRHRRVGDGEGRVVLDLRGNANAIPAWRMRSATEQVIRVTRVRRQSRLLVRAHSPWVDALIGLDKKVFRVQVREDPRGLLVTVFALPNSSGKGAVVVESPPDAGATVLWMRRSRENLRQWRVRVLAAEAAELQMFTVRSFNPLIGKIEALTQLMAASPVASLVVGDGGGIVRLLRREVRFRQVDLHQADQALEGVEVKQASPNWLLLRRAPTCRRRR